MDAGKVVIGGAIEAAVARPAEQYSFKGRERQAGPGRFRIL